MGWSLLIVSGALLTFALLVQKIVCKLPILSKTSERTFRSSGSVIQILLLDFPACEAVENLHSLHQMTQRIPTFVVRISFYSSLSLQQVIIHHNPFPSIYGQSGPDRDITHLWDAAETRHPEGPRR